VPLLLGNNNYFNVLTVEEIPKNSAVEKDTSNKKLEPPAQLLNGKGDFQKNWK